MKYYLNSKTGDVIALAADGSDDSFLTDDLKPMNDAQLYAHLNPPLTPRTREQVEALRLAAYANPLTGSDRFFAEAQRETLLGHGEAADAAKRSGLQRFAEIQASYPWPAD
ncbi:hypothetical protein [Pseudomonas mosselii]|uniref:hypothetical protein n=1 Tax=Pseudomonas mosselii TaxID=78327 RepID=UPI0018D7EF60|nr:hypothetical protein [Pseudomonas mosselii]MBH3322998.1 hypothetical protein [Pseudomonas mosselii]